MHDISDISNIDKPPMICEDALAIYQKAAEHGQTETSECVDCLLRLGLLRRASEGTLVAVPPAVAEQQTLRPLRRASERQLRQIAALESIFDAAAEAYATGQSRRTEFIRTVTGRRTISAVLQVAVDGCTEELLTLQPGGQRPAELLEKALESELPGLRRGVRQRTLYQHAIRSHWPTIDYIDKILAAGGEVRTLDEVVDRLIIIDRKVAYIPASTARAEEALEVRHFGMVRYLVDVFEKAWARAVPIGEVDITRRPPQIVDQTLRIIARMLVDGYTDSRIAKELGVSERTVAKHARRLSDQLNSTSRAQLGYLVAQHRLIDRDQDPSSS